MATSTNSNPNIKVLIADDDPPTRILLKAAISQWGYQIMEASDGEGAWKILKENANENAPEILISDWIMPNLDGIGLCEKIKNELPHKPYIILLTQVTGTTNIIKGLEAGADEFLSKPFNMAELRSRLSVGARIIQQNKQLINYVKQMDKLNLVFADISKKITEVIQSSSGLEKSNNNTTHIKQITELDNYLKNMNQVINDFVKKD